MFYLSFCHSDNRIALENDWLHQAQGFMGKKQKNQVHVHRWGKI